MIDLSHLNNMQQRAVETTEGPLLILAGAGSGKTTVLINRIANILDRGLAEPWQIIAITFTNKAAGELKSRLERMLGREKSQDVWAMTFHGACARMLRRDAERLGFSKNFTIYDQADSIAVVKRILKEMNLDEKVFPPRAVLSACERYKSQLMTPEDFLSEEKASGDIRRERIAQVALAYSKRLKEAEALDFEDLLYYCVRLLSENLDILQRYQSQFKYVLVDEYQDTNHLQYLFTSALAGKYRNICVVGDDDQSIYKFRGATIENILSFEKQYPDAEVIRLEQNYRSTGNILNAANNVIANNTERKGKNLWTDKGEGELITLYTALNEDDEAAYIARTICNAHRPMSEFAVLYRTNAQSRSIEQSLRHYGVAYKIYGGTRFFDRAEVKDMLAYLCVIANPTDETRLLRIVNEPPRGIGQTSLERARAAAEEEGVPLFEVLRTASHRAGISAGKRMEEFCLMIEELQQQVAQMPLDEFYDLVIERTGYVAALEAKQTDENLSRIENVYELKTSIAKSMESSDGGDLYGFLDEVALFTDLDNYDSSEPTVSLMTMHSAKGLEFPVVFIAGAEEGLFPGPLCTDPSEMEEERRLCYVAITRAMKKLYITCANQRMLYGRTESKQPSRFTEEIPEELLDRQGRKPQRKEYTPRSDGTDFFAADRRAWDDQPRGVVFGGYTRISPKSTVAKRTVTAPKPAAAAPAPDFKTGDTVQHKAFGRGVISALQPMGNDALVTIDFESAGQKKLMLRVAAQHMKKEEG